MITKRDFPKKVYANKSLTSSNSYKFSSTKPQVQPKVNKTKFSYFGSKVTKSEVPNSSLLPSGKVKRGPGRPKKVVKDNYDNNYDVKEKRLKLDCNSKIKHKTSSSSSSDLSPPVLEPWSPFSPRKDSTRTPPTLSPVSSMAKLSDPQKSSDDEKYFENKIVKKRCTSSTLVRNLFNPYCIYNLIFLCAHFFCIVHCIFFL